jgi:imidazolonepropionase-like amidohydrolase
MLDAIEFAEKHKLKVILSGGSESWKLAATLAEKQIPVILSTPTTYPSGEFEPWDSVYRCPKVLDDAGVRFCFASGSAADGYNFGIEIGMAVAHGLPLGRAEYAVTRGAAEILGLAGERGSIEVGKRADLIVTTDSPLQTICQVTHMFMDGRPIELTSLHTENYEKFKNRPAPRLPAPRALRGPPSLSTPPKSRP